MKAYLGRYTSKKRFGKVRLVMETYFFIDISIEARYTLMLEYSTKKHIWSRWKMLYIIESPSVDNLALKEMYTLFSKNVEKGLDRGWVESQIMVHFL